MEKWERYRLMLRQAEALLEGERHMVPNLANLSALMMGTLEEINWAGFYLLEGGELLLGPFQGKPACIHIPLGRGVCGMSAERKETLVVEDVHRFPGHIACDGDSRSEIVVPLLEPKSHRVLGVLDVDSPRLARFDGEDAAGLGRLARLLETACDWKR